MATSSAVGTGSYTWRASTGPGEPAFVQLQEVHMSKLVARIGLPALAVLAFAGCGSSSSSTSTSTPSTATVPTPTANAAIAAEVPAAIKSKGTLNVATEAQYAPNEFIAPDGHTVIGAGRGPHHGARRRDGPEGEPHQLELRNDHPGARRRAGTTSAPRRSPTPRNARRRSTSSPTTPPASPSTPSARRTRA